MALKGLGRREVGHHQEGVLLQERWQGAIKGRRPEMWQGCPKSFSCKTSSVNQPVLWEKALELVRETIELLRSVGIGAA